MFELKDKINNIYLLLFTMSIVYGYSVFLRLFNIDKIKNILNTGNNELLLYNKASYDNAIISSKNFVETNLFSNNFFTDFLSTLYYILPFSANNINFYFSMFFGSLIVVPIIYYFNKINYFTLGLLISIVITSLVPYYHLTDGGVLNKNIIVVLFLTIIQLVTIVHIKSIIEKQEKTDDTHYYLIPLLLSLVISLNNELYIFVYINVVIFLIMSMKYINISFLTLAIIYLLTTMDFSSNYIVNVIIVLILSFVLKGYTNIKEKKFIEEREKKDINFNTFGNYFFNTIVLLILSIALNIEITKTELETLYFNSYNSFPITVGDTANYFFFSNTILFYASIFIGLYVIILKQRYFLILIVLDLIGLLTFITSSENHYYLIYMISFGLALLIIFISNLLTSKVHKNKNFVYLYVTLFTFSITILNFDEIRLSSKSLLIYNYNILEISKNKKFEKEDYVISTFNNSTDIKYFLNTRVISSSHYKYIDNIINHNILYLHNNYTSTIKNNIKTYNEYLEKHLDISFIEYLETEYNITNMVDFNNINSNNIEIPNNPNMNEKIKRKEFKNNVYFYVSPKDLRIFLSASNMYKDVYKNLVWFNEKDFKDDMNKNDFFVMSDGYNNYYLSNEFKNTLFIKLLLGELDDEFEVLAKNDGSYLYKMRKLSY